MKRTLMTGALCAGLLAGTPPAHALFGVGDMVFDPTQAGNMLQSLANQGKAAADRIVAINNQLTQIAQLVATANAVAHGNLAAAATLVPQLSALGVTVPLGSDVTSIASSIAGAARAGGQLYAAGSATGALAMGILRTDQYYAPHGSDFTASQIVALANALAAQKAAAQTMLQANTDRINHLNTLQASLGNTADVKAAADASARMGGEIALAQAQNNQMLAMMMLAQARRDTAEAQRQQMERCGVERFIARQRAALAAAQAGVVQLIPPQAGPACTVPDAANGANPPVANANGPSAPSGD